MDPLSAAASIIAIVHISQIILLACYRIQGQVKDADDDISRIIRDVEALEAILEELRPILSPADREGEGGGDVGSSLKDLTLQPSDGRSRTGRGQTSAACGAALRACEAVLKEICDKLQPLAKPGSLKRKLVWPFESSSIQKKLDAVEKHKATLQLALAAHQARSLDQQSQTLAASHGAAKRMAILNWYKTSDPEQNHKVSRSKHEPETAAWIFATSEFSSWAERPGGELLWLHGIPGAGKTILCSTIIDYLLGLSRDKPGVAVAYFYFDFSDAKKQTAGHMARSLIYQLIAAADPVPEAATELYDKHTALTEPGLDELMAVVLAEVARTERTFVVIDALDECARDERQLFFDAFARQALPANLGLLMTSRKEPDIDAALAPAAAYTVCIQSSQIDADVRIHVRNSIARDARLSKWKPAIRDEILDAIVAGSHGMFRWAVCQLDTMKKCLTPAMVHAELRRMPETLDQTYDRILQSVPALHRQFVQSSLHWLAFAARPLLLEELAEAAVVDPRSPDLFDPDRARLFEPTLVLELCGTLVTSSALPYTAKMADWLTDKLSFQYGFRAPFLGGNDDVRPPFSVVSLSHYSVKEYIASAALRSRSDLLAAFYASEAVAHSFLTRSCILYLLSFNGGDIADRIAFDDWPLLEYAARYWMDHWKAAAAGGLEAESRALLDRMFDLTADDSRAYVNWRNIGALDACPHQSDYYHLIYRRDVRSSALAYSQPLYWAAALGYLDLVRGLVERGGADVGAKEGNFGSALGVAAHRGHAAVVAYLMSRGADPNASSVQLGSVLQMAALGGSAAVVELLLDGGADVNAQGGQHNTALVAAASREHYDVVALLLRRGADLSLSSRSYGSSLFQAALSADTKMVVTLLGAGADVNELGDSDGTALYAAAISGSVALVQLLLRRGADVNRGGRGQFGYPIAAAAHKAHVHVVRVLVRAGADLDLWGGARGVTPLEAAVEGRDMATFLALLDAGANPNTQADMYENCFHAAIWTGERDMARVLLDRGADFGDEGFVASVEVYDSYPYFVDTLLRRRPSMDASSAKHSLLHMAIKSGGKKATAAWLLMEQGANVNAVANGGSVLSCAINRDLVDLSKEILRRGADPNRSVDSDTPFTDAIYRACRRHNHDDDDDGNDEVDGKNNDGDNDDGVEIDLSLADLLLKKGADVNGGNGLALYWACKTGRKRVVEYLVKNGADLSLVNARHGCTALHVAVEEGWRHIVDFLLELGVNINGPPGRKGSLAFSALRSGDEGLFKSLVDRGMSLQETDRSLLNLAITSKQFHLLPYLIEHGANVNGATSGPSPLVCAFHRWNKSRASCDLLRQHGATLTSRDASNFIAAMSEPGLDDVKQLLDWGMNPNCNDTFQSCIEAAVKIGGIKMVRLLQEYGADVNYLEGNVESALSAACARGSLEIAEYLLDQGADPNVYVESCGTPLSRAANNVGSLELVSLLLRHGADVAIADGHVFSRAIYGGEKVLARLLRAPLGPHLRERFLNKALQHASHWGLLDLVGWLLDHGAPAAYRGGTWGCALTAAVCNSQTHDAAQINNRRLIIELLLGRGADVNPAPLANTEPNFNAEVMADTHPSPLTAALQNRGMSAAVTLLAAGADPTIVGGGLHTALQAAARHCRPMLGPLLAAGADPRVVGGKFGTALHAAAYTHDIDAIDTLLRAGADAKAVAGKYGTVLQAAAKRNTTSTGDWTSGRRSVAAMRALVAAGADVHARTGKYDTALQMAAKSDNLDAVRWLIEDMGADVNAKGGRFGGVREAAVHKSRWRIVTYLEQRFGPITWTGNPFRKEEADDVVVHYAGSEPS